MTAVMGVWVTRTVSTCLRDTVLDDEEVFFLEVGDELVGLVEEDVDIEIDDRDVDTKGVGVTVGILDAGLGGGGGRDRYIVRILLFLEDDRAIIGLRAALVRGRLLRRGGGWRSVLGSGGQREKESKGGEEERTGRMVFAGGHYLKLYSGWSVSADLWHIDR